MPMIGGPRTPRRFDSDACGREGIYAERRICAIDAAPGSDAAAGKCRDCSANGDDLVQAATDLIWRHQAAPKFSEYPCHAWAARRSRGVAYAAKTRREARPEAALSRVLQGPHRHC